MMVAAAETIGDLEWAVPTQDIGGRSQDDVHVYFKNSSSSGKSSLLG